MLFWKIAYFFMMFSITFICSIDSWEYLYQAQTQPFQDFFHQVQFTVFQSGVYTSILKMACFTSLFYSLPFFFFMLLRLFSTSLFLEELYTLFVYFLCLFFIIKGSFIFTNRFLPIYFEDFFYYQHQKDLMFNFELKWILEPHFYLRTKIYFFLLFFIFFLTPLFFYFFAVRKRSSFFFVLEKKKWVYFFFSFLFLLFFEAHFQETIKMTLFFVGYFEWVCFLLSVIYRYNFTNIK